MTLSRTPTFEVGSQWMLRGFIESLLEKEPTPGSGMVDWSTIESLVADTSTFEQAIGRAAVIASQMCRGTGGPGLAHGSGEPSTSRIVAAGESEALPVEARTSEPADSFFDVSVLDAVPDFGDGHRLRTRIASRATRLFRAPQPVTTPAVS